MITGFLKTLQTNLRDIIAFILIGLGIAILGGLVDYVSALFGSSKFVALVFPTVSNYLQGFSKFIGASITATLLWMLLWPTVNEFGNHTFQEGWKSLTLPQQFATYVSLIIAALLAAAICFSK